MVQIGHFIPERSLSFALLTMISIQPCTIRKQSISTKSTLLFLSLFSSYSDLLGRGFYLDLTQILTINLQGNV